MTQTQFNHLKIGDKVRVKRNIIPGATYNYIRFTINMDKYRGKIITVLNRSNIPQLDYVDCADLSQPGYFSYTKDTIDIPFKFGK